MPEYSDEKSTTEFTVRQQILMELESGYVSCRDLSQRIHQSEKEILSHLEHLRLSVRQQKKKFIIDPSVCRKCNYIFDNRSRLAKPGRCPKCRATTIEPPLFSVASK